MNARTLISGTSAILVAASIYGSELDKPSSHTSIPKITVLPIPSEKTAPASYCKKDGKRLIVELQNVGDKAGRDIGWIRVTYETLNGPIEHKRFLYWLDVSEIAGLYFEIAPGCFKPDCNFTVRWPENPPVVGVCSV